MLPDLPVHDCAATKPFPFHVIRLELADGRRVFGSWTGTRWIAAGEEVQPRFWQELTKVSREQEGVLREESKMHVHLGEAVVTVISRNESQPNGANANGNGATNPGSGTER